MEEIYILNKESVNNCDPHGYFSNVGHQNIDFKNPTKRSFLSDCIRKIHEIKDNGFPIVKTKPAKYNTQPKLSTEQVSIERVKRQLFPESQWRLRKLRQPIHNDRPVCECLYFKPYRSALCIRKIPRSYLEGARYRVYDYIRQYLKREHFDKYDDTNENIANYSTQEEQLGRERNTESGGLSRRQMIEEQQYRERFLFNGKKEASKRSILYMRTLLHLMADQKD